MLLVKQAGSKWRTEPEPIERLANDPRTLLLFGVWLWTRRTIDLNDDFLAVASGNCGTTDSTFLCYRSGIFGYFDRKGRKTLFGMIVLRRKRHFFFFEPRTLCVSISPHEFHPQHALEKRSH